MFWIGLKIRMFCHRVDDFTELRFAAPLTIFRTANLVTRATSIALYTQYDAEHSNSTSDRRSTLSSLSITSNVARKCGHKNWDMQHHGRVTTTSFEPGSCQQMLRGSTWCFLGH